MKLLILIVIGIFLALSSGISIAHADHLPPSCVRDITGGPDVPIDPELKYQFGPKWGVTIEGQVRSFSYDGHIHNATANVEKHSLNFNVDSSCLFLRLSRDLIDSTQNGQDVPFTVLVNGQVSEDVVEDVVPSTGDRVLSIKIPQDYSNVEIIGTTIAPEFGALAALLVPLAMAGIVAYSTIFRKHRGSLPSQKDLSQIN
ncbi:hypothetical protein NWT39_13825 [Nitrososphaera viennensis]|uniref:PEFG-CTERM sorting domain-containing protein n=1 Tax=Nitrososphaera viennensis TaxID=1034015 RepID=A0A977NM20_9ARCH|nr:hypothetical protein [Nitrososphaera viennensis]UVS68972.1 hypothetical protein NWT39_13825 [Nitrososphaera viennensis]